jgi:cytochrome c2
MLSRIRTAIGLALLFAIVFAFPAFAGGWAVITLDELPSNVVAGEPLSIGFTVLQHGRTPMTDLHPTLTAKLSSAETMVFSAEPNGKPGHYVATLTFPKEGSWEWSIQAFTMDQPMPVLNVAPSNTASANQPATKIESKPASLTPLLLLRVLAFGIAVIGLILAFRRKSRLTGALAGLCLLVGAGTFMTGMTTPKVEVQSKESSEISIESSASQVELGRQLFIAKGCITCHNNDRAADRSEYWTIEMGATDLSNFSASPEVLFVRLKDPAAAKSDTKMPNLGLKKTEIEALVAFINSK